MTREAGRHYTEEELLLHLIQELPDTVSSQLEGHLTGCRECAGVLAGFREVLRSIESWKVPDVSPMRWEDVRHHVLEEFRRERESIGRTGTWRSLTRLAQAVWNYALENPLPTLGYVVAAVAFTSERTITVFRLDRVLPATGELIEILRRTL